MLWRTTKPLGHLHTTATQAEASLHSLGPGRQAAGTGWREAHPALTHTPNIDTHTHSPDTHTQPTLTCTHSPDTHTHTTNIDTHTALTHSAPKANARLHIHPTLKHTHMVPGTETQAHMPTVQTHI